MALSRVMINSPWQADDDADNQSGDNRGDSAHTSISDRSARFFEFWQSGRQPYARTDHNQRPGSEAQILLQRSIAWRISPRSIIGKAPRSLICCNATASWLPREKSSGQAACGRHPTNGKEAAERSAPVDLSFGFSVTSLRGWSENGK